MKFPLLIIACAFFHHINVNGQITSDAKDENEKVFVYVDKQTGETFNQDMEYQLMQWYQGVARYIFKVSGDTNYVYLDKDPVSARMFIDSVSQVRLNTFIDLGEFINNKGTLFVQDNLDDNVIVLNFWATWCAPCIAEFPALNKLVDSFQHKSVLFLAPTRETPHQMDGFFSQREFDYQIIPDAKALAEKFNVFAVPTHIIIDKKGIVRFIQVGGDNETIAMVLAREIEKYL